MGTDYTSNIAEDLGASHFKMTCILEEGALTVSDGYNIGGGKETIVTPAAPIAVNDLVYLIAGTKNLGVETNLLPVVAKLTNGTFYVGRVTSTPEWDTVPSASKGFTSCSDTDWAEILAGKWYRKASVEFFGITGAFAGTVTADGSDPIPVAAMANLKWGVGAGTYSYSTGGTGLVPMHHTPAGSSGDTYTIMIGVLATSIIAKA